MGWFRQAVADGAIADAPVVERTDGECSLRLPVSAGGRVCAFLQMEYSAHEPLTIEVTLRSPSGAPAVERTVLRRDARSAMFEPVLLPELTIGPAGVPGTVAVVFQEHSIAVPVTLPARVYAEFLRGCDAIVRMNERAEAEALTRALAFESETWP
jgi:hypothetical protein